MLTEVLTAWPLPVRSREYSAVMIPSASCTPPPVSATTSPIITGSASGPVIETIPPRACAAPSKPFLPASGPVGPKPEQTA